jgi:hypothetical protein
MRVTVFVRRVYASLPKLFPLERVSERIRDPQSGITLLALSSQHIAPPESLLIAVKARTFNEQERSMSKNVQ